MLRKLSLIFIIGLLALTAACSSSSSSTNAASPVTGVAAGASASAAPTACPTSNTKSFAKTRFVADLALAGGAFKRYIYTPAKSGKFSKGAHGRVLAFVKAAAAGAFTVNRLEAAKSAAEANPTLCKLLAEPIAKFSAAVSGLAGKAKSGNVTAADVENTNGYLSDLHGAASQGGTAFSDNTDASV
jgi:hypothetical protein